jgi:ABC-type microcin C transport system permease subunit YejB
MPAESQPPSQRPVSPLAFRQDQGMGLVQGRLGISLEEGKGKDPREGPLHLFYYLNDIVHLNLGRSYLESRPVIESLAQYFPATLELTIFAMLIAIPLGIVGGIISAIRRNKLSDHITRIIAIVGYSAHAKFKCFFNSKVRVYYIKNVILPF